MSIREQRKNKHTKWTKDINSAKNKYLTELIKKISTFIKMVSKLEDKTKIKKLFEEFKDEILDLIYKSLEKTYTLTSKSVKDIYNITSKTAKIKDLTYNGDGKTLDERIEQYFLDLIEYVAANEDVDWNIIKNNLNYRLMLILDTETQAVKIKVTHTKIEGYCEFGEVLPGECCAGSGGIYPIDELELPPYHPNCRCEVIYYEELTDDEEENQDLELEVENIYE